MKSTKRLVRQATGLAMMMRMKMVMMMNRRNREKSDCREGGKTIALTP